MRSRYTAFTLGDAAYLRSSWHPATRPDRLEIDDDLEWVRLDIAEVEGGRDEDVRGTVTFRAHWRHTSSGERGVLSETSRFRRSDGRWVYLDGVDGGRSV